MRQSKFTETQIVSILKEADTGVPATRSGGATASVRDLLQVESQVRRLRGL